MEPAAITVDESELTGIDPLEDFEQPGRLLRFWLWLCRPLIPLANRAARHHYEVQLARARTELASKERERAAAVLKADAETQKAETLARMHARIVAMLDAEIAVHNATTRRTKGAE